MKKLILILIVVLSNLYSYGQFINYEPFVPSVPGKPSSNSSTSRHSSISGETNSGELVRTTGYILDVNGRVKQKISLKVLAISDIYGEKVTIKEYYVNSAYVGGTQWKKISLRGEVISGNVAFSKQEEVGNANFNYWAYWDSGNKIWFSL